MTAISTDIKHGFRMLWRNPGFSVLVVLVLALGIGANSAIFSVVNAVLLEPLPFDEPESLVTIWQTDLEEGNMRFRVSYPNVEDWRKECSAFEGIAALCFRSKTFHGQEYPIEIDGVCASANLFSLLRIQPLLGRAFSEQEERDRITDRVILGHDFWRQHYQSNPDIVGTSIRLGDRSYTVIGVLPDIQFPGEDLGRIQIWTLISEESYMMSQRAAHGFQTLARLKPGVSLKAAQAQLDAVASHLAEVHEDNEGMGAHVTTLHSDLIRDVHVALWVLFGAVGLVLLGACANVANLLTIRASVRTREFALRAALGAGRWRLIRQTLIESLVLSLIGGAMGLLLADWGIGAIRVIVPGELPRIDDIGLDGRVVAFTIVIAVVTGILFGLAPALQGSARRTYETLKKSARSTAGTHRNSLRNALVVGEVATAMVLLIGAALLIRSFLGLIHVDTGFQSEQVLTWQVGLSGPAFGENEAKRSFYRQFVQHLQATPGIRAVGATTTLPFADNMGVGIKRLTGPERMRQDYLPTRYNSITPGYFQAMGIPLRQGRLFSEIEMESKRGAVIINETMARLHFEGEDPIGQRINPGLRIGKDNPDSYEIVGIVGDTRQRGFDVETKAEIFLPFSQQTWGTMTFAARVAGDPMAMVAPIRAAASQLNREILVDRFKMMSQWTAESVAKRRFVMTLIALFAGLTFGLTIVGIYGVMAYVTTQRTHEIGVRMALGAGTHNVISMILRSGAKLVLAGVCLGTAGAILLCRYLRSMLFEITATDPTSYGIAAVLLIAVSLLACYLPARRASKIDPMEALRHE